MRLLHLTAVGADVTSATLEFAPKLTLVYGASETGKSYIIEAIDYMLGARALRDIPQARGYQSMLLGIELNDLSLITLARDLRGGKLSLFNEDIRTLPRRVPDRVLNEQHSKGNLENISSFLLSQLGIHDAKLRKNKQNALQAASFRYLAHLCLIDEGRMQSKISPVESGIPTARTAERAAFKLLIEGADDSNLSTGQNSAEFKRVNRGQVEVLERAILQLTEQLAGVPEREQLLAQLARINAAIAGVSESIGVELAERDTLVARRIELQERIQMQQQMFSEANTLHSRFSLLEQQYTSDLDRLQMVKEAGTLLGYFATGVCVFCGAGPEHQNIDHAIYESNELAESVDAESAKTRALRQDLVLTIQEVARQRADAIEIVRSSSLQLRKLSSRIAELEQSVRPLHDDITRFLGVRSEVERKLGLQARVSELEALLSAVARERPTAVDPAGHGISVATQREFSMTLRRILTSWQVPDSADAMVDFSDAPEIVMGQRRRKDRGKGMRSVLHAGFSISLSEYCLERDLPHPGFVALDTPVLTYRDADKAEMSAGDDELLSPSVAQAFYAYLSAGNSGQVIVLENQTPPAVENDDCSIVYFSGTPGVGRTGFYPG